MVELFENSNKLIDAVDLGFKRFMFDKVNWDGRLVEINGARGVGKTTMMYQKAKILTQLGYNSPKKNKLPLFCRIAIHNSHIFRGRIFERPFVVGYGVWFSR